MKEQLEVLKEANEYIERLYDGISMSVKHLRNNNLEQGYKLVGQISEGIEWLYDVFRLTQNIQIDKMSDEELGNICSVMIEAMENKDHSLVADILEFEVIEKVQVWKTRLYGTIEHYNL